jgi:hypothetical protein
MGNFPLEKADLDISLDPEILAGLENSYVDWAERE